MGARVGVGTGGPNNPERGRVSGPGDDGISFRSTFARIVSALGVPFGYTLSIWASSQLAIEQFGPASFAHIMLFVGGAIAAYLLMAVASSSRLLGGRTVRAGEIPLLNVGALLTAIGASVLSRLVASPYLGFFLMGFGATFMYALLLSSLIYLRWRLGPKDTP